MKSAGFRIRIEPALRQAFVQACNEKGVSAAHVLRSFMRNYVDRTLALKQTSLFDQPEPGFLDTEDTKA